MALEKYIYFSSYNNITKRVNSNEESFLIDRIIDIKIDSQDLKSVEVNPLDKARVLTFEVSNLGNSEENIIINNNSDVNSDFFALNKKVFIDSNNNALFDLNDTEVKDKILLN